MHVEAIMFDCDGTLVDSESLGFEAIIAEAQAIGVTFTAAELEAMKGRSMAAFLDAIAERHGRSLPSGFELQLRSRMAAIFRERLQPMPGALTLLDSLDVPYCIASNGPLHKIELTLSVTGLLSYFLGRIFSAYEIDSFKPKPDLFLHAARTMGVVPEHCVVVEDSEAGVLAGLAAGMTVYFLRSSQPLPSGLAARVQVLDRLSDLDMSSWNLPTRTGDT